MMKRTLCVLLLAIILCGCGSNSTQENEESSQFEIVEESYTYTIVYDKETKVMYSISDGGHSEGIFTMLVNADGSPRLYK